MIDSWKGFGRTGIVHRQLELQHEGERNLNGERRMTAREMAARRVATVMAAKGGRQENYGLISCELTGRSRGKKNAGGSARPRYFDGNETKSEWRPRLRLGETKPWWQHAWSTTVAGEKFLVCCDFWWWSILINISGDGCQNKEHGE